jgi:hypothetical protein
MSERQLRNRNIVTEMETRLQIVESDNTDCNMDAEIARIIPTGNERSKQNNEEIVIEENRRFPEASFPA